MNSMLRKFLFVVFAGVIASCASRHAAKPGPYVPPPIKSIAVVTGDALASAIGVELYNQGFKTFEVPATQELTPKALHSLAMGGVDAVLVVRSGRRGFDSLPENASLHLVRTQTGETVVSLDWSNPGLGAGRTKVADVAKELVRRLLETVPKPIAR